MLRELYLQHNQLVSIADQTFKGLGHLTTLHLDSNLLISIGKGAFKETPSLQHLDLSANRFLTIKRDTFTGLQDLMSLNLAGNQLEDMNGLLISQANLTWLNLSQNHLKWFDYAFIPQHLAWLDIHDNRIEELGNYFGLGKKHALMYIDARENKITRLKASSVLPSIEELRLQDNLISHIAPNTFLGKPNLTTVHLQNNRLSTLDMTSLKVSISPTKGRI